MRIISPTSGKPACEFLFNHSCNPIPSTYPIMSICSSVVDGMLACLSIYPSIHPSMLARDTVDRIELYISNTEYGINFTVKFAKVLQSISHLCSSTFCGYTFIGPDT